MKILTLTLTFSILLGAPAALAEHYRVYLLGGQSNGNGRANAAELTGPLAALGAPQTDVRFYWHKTQNTDNDGHLIKDTWIDLAPGSGHGKTAPVYTKEFGSELSFGRTMADADPAVKIAIIKYAHGGTNLHTDWSASGNRYTTFRNAVTAGLAALTTAGHTYELSGMIWQQGEADTNAASTANAYEANLTSLIARVRQDLFGGAALPFIIGSLSNSQDASITTVGSNWYKVRQAQETVATNGNYVGFVNTDGYTTRPNDSIHFAHGGQIDLGEDLPAASSGTTTTWITSTTPAPSSGIIASYTAPSALNGDFNTTDFDSNDTELSSVASRLSQGGSLTGGPNANFVLSNTLFDSSDSGSPGFNFGSVNTSNQSAAATAGDWFKFDVQSGGSEMTYESLSFFCDQFETGAKIDVSYSIGGVETFILQGLVPLADNAAVEKQTLDFTDFVSTEKVTWTFYLYGSSDVRYGTRFDDIILHGKGAVEPPGNRNFYRLKLQ